MNLETYKQKLEEVADLTEQLHAIAAKAFSDAAKSLFEQHTKLDSFRWQQYTPYFNDGSPCEFTVYTDEFDIKVNGPVEGFDPDDTNDDGWIEYAWGEADTEARGLTDSLSAFIEVFSEDDLRYMFGDHVQVTVTRDGVSTEHYEHD